MSSKIIRLAASNVKRLEAVEITPQGHLISIGGVNGAGKSSVLDSILWGIAGGREVAEIPVRKGEERAVIEIDLDDLKVRRTFSANGNMTLVVTNKEGAKYPSPQAILDSLLGKLGFDPLEFSRQKPAEQYETLRALAGLDFTAIEKQRQEAYDQRTILGREIKTLEGQLAGLQLHPDVPDEEVQTVEIMQKWREASEKNEANRRVRDELTTRRNREAVVQSNLDVALGRVIDIEGQIVELQRKLDVQKKAVEELRSDMAQAQDAIVTKEQEIAGLEDVNLEPFKLEISTADETNRKIRQNQQRAKVSAELQAKRSAHTSADQKIENLDIEKRRMISKAKLPIGGLSFEAGRVLLNGLPFSQLSSAEQLKVSVAVGLALNPKLKVLLIRDGSLLDENSLKMIAEMASTADAQVWCELVRTDGDLSVVIEDGLVRGAPRPEPVAAPVAETAEAPTAVEPPTPPTAKPARKKREPFVPSTQDLIP